MHAGTHDSALQQNKVGARIHINAAYCPHTAASEVVQWVLAQHARPPTACAACTQRSPTATPSDTEAVKAVYTIGMDQ